jgi:hypothetical protein
MARYDTMEKLLTVNNESIWNRIMFWWQKRKIVDKGSEKFEMVASMIMQRILEWIHSIEFNHVCKLPPDFHINHAIYNMHVWLITNHLKSFNTRESKYLVTLIEQSFAQITNYKVTKIHLKKKNDFIKDLNSFMRLNRNSFEKHFQVNAKTSVNPIYKIDALLWSTSNHFPPLKN